MLDMYMHQSFHKNIVLPKDHKMIFKSPLEKKNVKNQYDKKNPFLFFFFFSDLRFKMYPVFLPSQNVKLPSQS